MSDQVTNNGWINEIKTPTGQWSGLEDLAASPEAADAVRSELMSKIPSHFLSRRDFMGWMAGLSAVLTTSCTRQPPEHILPYHEDQEGMIPGKPMFFASAFPYNGNVTGIVVESHMGRPTKVEGNPDHIASRGSTGSFAQASILGLYDPDRLRSVQYNGVNSAYSTFVDNLMVRLKEAQASQGAGVALVTGPITSPTLAAQVREFLKKNPAAKWVRDSGTGTSGNEEGTKLAFGKALTPNYKLDVANVVLSLDADFMQEGPGHLGLARDFASRRGAEQGQEFFNRLYSLECTPTATGSLADHRWPVKPDEIYAVSLEIARNVGVAGVPSVTLSDEWKRLAELIAADMKANRGKVAIIPGLYQPKELHAIAHAMNSALGAIGSTVTYTETAEQMPGKPGTLKELAEALASGSVETLVIVGGDPVYTAPPEFNIGEAIAQVKFSVHFTEFANDTSSKAQWIVPRTHFLENWSDGRAFDGTATIIQPLIRPLHGAKSDHELLAVMNGTAKPNPLKMIQENWKGTLKGDLGWRKAVHDGIVPGSKFSNERVSLQMRRFSAPFSQAGEGFAVILRPDPTIGDGTFANNGWLQELPKPGTQVTWDNTVQVSPATASRLGVKNGQMVHVTVGDRKVRGPAWIVPGQPKDTLTLHLGYGRGRVGRVGKGFGFNAYRLRSAADQWTFFGAKVQPTTDRMDIACTQRHHDTGFRDLVRHTTWDKFRKNPDTFIEAHPHYPDPKKVQTENDGGPVFEDPHYKWGMAIDLSVCNGCNACVVGCNAENNVTTVGKDQVLLGREMHWIRVDRYNEGDAENPQTFNQPVPCMHCERAPCEVVCPVGATTHSPSGINEMTYNRCVGTKYCGNNCPYKVRRFNWLKYHDADNPLTALGKNPDVTVRSRGVMEKCTYCVQRINHARIEAKKENRTIREGEVVTACQSVCPSQAIVFGNLKDPNSRVSKLKAHKAEYGTLEELGVRPRTTYIARLTNPNPAIQEFEKGKS